MRKYKYLYILTFLILSFFITNMYFINIEKDKNSDNNISYSQYENYLSDVNRDIYALAQNPTEENLNKIRNYHLQGITIATLIYYSSLNKDGIQYDYYYYIREGLKGALNNDIYFFESIVYLSILESNGQLTKEEKTLLDNFRKQKFL